MTIFGNRSVLETKNSYNYWYEDDIGLFRHADDVLKLD